MIYGLRGKTHGWGHVLNVLVLSPSLRATKLMTDIDGLEVVDDTGPVTRFRELHGGAIDALIERYGIVVVDHDEWNNKKRESAKR